MKGITLVPSLNRIDNLVRFCKSLKETETTTPGFIIVDSKDFESKKSTYTELKHDYFLDNWDFRIGPAVRMGDKVRQVWPEIEAMDLDWVNLENDDHVHITHDWDIKLGSQITGKNIISCMDRWNSPRKMAGATMISMELLKVFGFPIFPPGLQHMYIDDMLETIGMQTGCWDIDHSVVIEHRHVLKKESPLDSTHQASYSKAAWEIDRVAYQAFLDNQMGPLIQRIKEFTAETIQKRSLHA